MGTRRDPGFGLMLIDDRFTPDTESAQGAGATDSSYTQAGPQPGTPEPGDSASSWRPQITSYQDAGLSSIVLRSGYPGQDRTGRPAASVALRSSSSTSEDDYIGWDDPVTCAGWVSTGNLFGGSAAVDAVAATVIPDTQEIVLFTCTSAGASRLVSRFDPRKEVWTETTNPMPSLVISTPIALAYDVERERLILYSGSGAAYDSATTAWYSTDKGATWDIYARGLYDQTTLAGRTTVAPQPQRAWAMLRCASGGYGQFASSDHGASWQRVDSNTAVWSGSQGRIIPLQSGAFLVVYVEATTLDLKAVRLPTANIRIADLSAVTITSTNVATFTATTDADGIVYVHWTRDTTETQDISCYRSLDEGVSWEAYKWKTGASSSTVYPNLITSVSAGGEVAIVHSMTGAAALSDSVGVLRMGGWSSVEGGCGDTGLSTRLERTGFGVYTGTGSINPGRAWYPLDVPSNMGWTATGGGTASWSGSNGAGLDLTTTAAQQLYYTRADTGSSRTIAVQADLSVVTGDNTGTTGPQIRITLADAGGAPYEYECRILVGATTVRVVDPNGSLNTTSATVSTMGTTGIRIRAVVTQDGAGNAFASVAYRPISTYVWTVLTNKTALTSRSPAVATDDGVVWGHYGLAAAQSVWRGLMYGYAADWTWGIEDAVDLEDDPWSEGHLGLSWGRALPGSAAPYPCGPAALTTYTAGSATDCPRIFASGGPARISEITQLPIGYRRAFSNIYPTIAPSPSRYWESTGTGEAIVAWNLTRANWIGDAIGLIAVGSYARQIALQYYDGAAWQTVGTLDLSLSSGTALNSTRAGDVLTPRAGTTEIGRYLTEGEMIGGYAILSKGAGFVARRIARQSAGYWSASAHQPVRITLEGVDGTEDVSGTSDLIAPAGVLVAYPTTAQARQRWRVRWAAAQVTPGSVYRAGVIGVGRVVGVGAEPGWTWQRSTQLAREIVRDRGGRVRSVRQLQAPSEVLSYDWQDGLDLFALRSSRTPDYVAASGGLAIGTVEDAASLLGYVEGTLRSGEVPCVVLPRLPATTGTITDPSLYFYGLLTSDSIGLSGVEGTEGTDEYVRLTGAAFERIR